MKRNSKDRQREESRAPGPGVRQLEQGAVSRPLKVESRIDVAYYVRRIEIHLAKSEWEEAKQMIELARQEASFARCERPRDRLLADLCHGAVPFYLEKIGVLTAGQAERLSDAAILAIPRFGPTMLEELDSALAGIGLARNGQKWRLEGR